VGGVGAGFFVLELLELGHEALADGGEARLGQGARHLGVQVRDDVDVGGVGSLDALAVLEVPEGETLDVVDEVLVAGVERELAENFDEDQAEDELDGEVAPFLLEIGLASFHDFQTGTRNQSFYRPVAQEARHFFFVNESCAWNFLNFSTPHHSKK